MQYEIVLTTAEDIVSVVDAALAGKDICDIQYISEFADISEQQAQNAIKMAGGMFTQTEATQKMDGKPLMEKNTILIPPDIVILDGCILIKLIIISTSQPES